MKVWELYKSETISLAIYQDQDFRFVAKGTFKECDVKLTDPERDCLFKIYKKDIDKPDREK